MGKIYAAIDDELRSFIAAQQMFFVATAPLSADGHINVSPKGMDTFRILTPNRVAYLDMTGSANETSAHVLENGRITFMFCAFSGSPEILRLFGHGQTILPGTPAWDDVSAHFSVYPGARQIITADIDRVQTSCGFGVPLFQFEGERDALRKFCATVDAAAYQQENNRESMDGLPTPIGQ